MEIYQMDVVSAFLAGDLEKEVYIERPRRYSKLGNNGGGLIYKLKRPLYGLKQAPRALYRRLHTFFLGLEFSRTNADHSIYTKLSTGTIICIYVDDLLLFSYSLDEIAHIKAQMTHEFEMKDLRELDCFLGMEIERDRERRLISLGQTDYVSKIIYQFGMDESHAVTTPVAMGTRLKVTVDTDEHFDTQISIRNWDFDVCNVGNKAGYCICC
jgi:hypothetical protein